MLAKQQVAPLCIGFYNRKSTFSSQIVTWPPLGPTDVLSADTTDVMAADTTDVLSADTSLQSGKALRCVALSRQVWYRKPNIYVLLFRFLTYTWDAWCWKPIFRNSSQNIICFTVWEPAWYTKADQDNPPNPAEMVHERQFGP